MHGSRWTGFTRTELAAVLAAVTCTMAVAIPVLGRVGGNSGVQTSMANLATLGMAHVLYAMDWNGRQVTWAVDELGTYGSVGDYNAQNQCGVGPPYENCHPGIAWGFGLDANLYGYWPTSSAHHWAYLPMNFTGGAQYFGHFRFPGVNPFHNYVGGRVYDPTFYAPNDTVVYGSAAPSFDVPAEYDIFVNPPFWPSYCMSPAAMYSPGVMRANADGGWQDPWSIPDGFTSPGLFQAAYPDLKTLMIEHSWVQGRPDDCNPAVSQFGSVYPCEPYYFNHGVDSAPVTLFYDGSVRLLPNAEVLAGDQQVLDQTGDVDGLWHRATPFGVNGYFIAEGFDGVPLSHHVLTTDGILGRDTLGQGGKPLAAPPAGPWPENLSRKRPAPPAFLENLSIVISPEDQP